ncbi:galactokinase [Pseudaquabacterium pictum]|uniref:Galactokinase n=1 Tax=Pseudaquabacterium pictum TaxID=2315236 RepID=A0A480AY93_9BURK|nr:galactokinase [Rubrivivax pictus]GCL66323.1 galactokinase [Rubrivivax pictus]
MPPDRPTSPLLPALLAGFQARFGAAPTTLAQAPGRVNLIGEHTDYNDGFVLPCAIDFHTLVAARPRSDGQVRVLALDLDGAGDSFRSDATIVHSRTAPWANYVRGVVRGLQQAGLAPSGADIAITGNVPQGAGLSSSAALEVALLHAWQHLQGLNALDATRIAQLAQRAENDFVGCRCGIMDQLISARGQAGHALLIDCRSLQARPVPLPAGVAVMIVHSRVQRGLVDSAYNERRAQCEAAARHFGVPALRDVSLDRLQADGAGLEALAWQRARHIVTENARTEAAAQALAAGDLVAMGRLMAESHASMRDDFAITVLAIDQLVTILQQAIGPVGGARMTGGGFGGCVVALLPQDRVDAAREAVARQYRAPGGEAAVVWVCQAQAGAAAGPAG